MNKERKRGKDERCEANSKKIIGEKIDPKQKAKEGAAEAGRRNPDAADEAQANSETEGATGRRWRTGTRNENESTSGGSIISVTSVNLS